MNPFTQIALPTTLTDLLQARMDAMRLLSDARRMIDMARDSLAQHGAYLMPHSGQIREDENRVRIDLDQRMWRRAFDLTGFKQLMDAQAVAEFEKSMHPAPPEFTEANIRSNLIDMQINAADMFRRGIVNVFRGLSDDYRTNEKEAFRIGRKVVTGWMVGPSFGGGLSVRHGLPSDKLNDIDRVMKTLDGKPFQPRELESAINGALKDGAVFEDDYFRVKGFKNGNLHIEFKRADLLDKLNEQIADHYANSLPDARSA